MVHSNRTVVVALHKQTLPVSDHWQLMLHKHLAFSVILSALSQIVGMLLWVSLTIRCMSTIRSPFSSRHIVSNFSSLIAFSRFFTWIAPGDADLCFLLIPTAGEEETQWTAWLYHQCYQSIHVTVGMTVTTLSASLLLKISAAMDCLYQIVLNRKLSCKLERWCKFSVCVKAKSCTKKLHETRPACINILFIVHWFSSDFRWTYSIWKHRYFVLKNALLLWTIFKQVLGVRTSKGNGVPL